MDRNPFWLVLPVATILLGIVVWPLRAMLAPILGTAALIYILYPYREHPVVRRLLTALVLLVLLWILARARAIVYPALASLAFAFLLDPVVNRLHRRGLPRPLAALLLMVPLAALATLLALVLAPAVVDQARKLISGLPEAYEAASAWIVATLDRWLAGRGIGLLEKHIGEIVPSTERILETLVAGIGQVGRGVAAVISVLSLLLLTPILTYYLLVDFGRLKASVRPYLSEAWSARMVSLGEILQASVGAWLKGQMIVTLIVALLTVGGLLLVGLPYALLIGLTTGLLNLVPILGFWISFLLAVAAAFFAPEPATMLLKASAVFLIIQALEGNVLSPRIVGRQLGVKPVVLLLAMLALSIFLGVLGLLLAAPIVGIARGLWQLWGPRPQRPELLETQREV